MNKNTLEEIYAFLSGEEADHQEGVELDDRGGVRIFLKEKTYNFTPEQKQLILEELERRLSK